jgi:hypothetical protein
MDLQMVMDETDWEELKAADEAAGRIVPEIVMHNRCSGILTWALLHRIENEVFAKLEASREHPQWVLNMLRSAPVLGYPIDDRPVAFSNASILPVIFRQIEKAWNLVH